MWEQVESLSKGSIGRLWQTLVMERDGERWGVEGIEDWIFLFLVRFTRRQSSICVGVRTPALFGCVQKRVHNASVLITQ